MAIPKTNANLSEMGQDCDVGTVPLSNIVLRRRAGGWGGTGNVSTADLRGSIASNQILKGGYKEPGSPDGNPARDRTHYKFYDPYSVGLYLSVTQDGTGKFSYSFTHKGSSSELVVQSLEYGMLPDSGKFQVEFSQVNYQTGDTFFRVEIIGNQRSWLQGASKIYQYKNVGNGESWTSNVLDVDPNYTYLTISMGLGFPGRNSPNSRYGDSRGARAYLV